MADKTSVTNIANLQSETTAVSAMNNNFTALANAIDLLLSRDGEAPNALLASLDANNNRIINLPVPISYHEAARHGDLQLYVDAAELAQSLAEIAQGHAETAQANAEIAETNAETAEANAAATLVTFLKQYMGAFAAAPSAYPDASALVEGTLYYNTERNTLFMWTVRRLYVGTEDVVVGADQVLISEWIELPSNFLRNMGDVEAPAITNKQLLEWNTGLSSFIPVSNIAANVGYTSSSLSATNVQDAIDEVEAAIEANLIRDAGDVDADAITDKQLLEWDTDTSKFVPVSNTAANTGFTSTVLSATNVQDAIDEVAELNINTYTDDHTLTLSDASSYIRMNKGTSVTLTVPTNASVAFPVGTNLTVRQVGAGQVTVAEASGVTINTPETLLMNGQYQTVSLVKVAADEWDIAGGLEAA